jgi:tRNA(Ile)-lysidine synthase
MNLENLDSVVDFIAENNLIEKGDRVGVGISGGEDSMALLHFLHSVADSVGIEIVAVHVNHCVRASSRKDGQFTAKYCKENGIQYIGYKVDVPAFAKSQKMGLEQACRIKRYECFALAVNRFKLNKFALAHHQSDQAETILLHIFRGSGIGGARGMDVTRSFLSVSKNGKIFPCTLVRPFLETPKNDIVAYNYRNQVPHIEDESNQDSTFARNFLRHEIIPALQKEWRGVEKNIVDFGRNCKSDDEYLNSVVNLKSLIGDENHIRIPLNFFVYRYPIITRIVLAAFERLGERENIERKHIDMIITLAKSGENGSRTDLPNNLYAVKEYEYLSVVRKMPSVAVKIYSFKIGRTLFAEYGTIIITKTISHKDAVKRGLMVIDADKLPRAAKWRTRKEGDTFTKFGGGTKSLNSYFIDRKIPSRLRDKTPVLAYGSEIYAIAGIEISELVKTDRETLEAYVLEFVKD